MLYNYINSIFRFVQKRKKKASLEKVEANTQTKREATDSTNIYIDAKTSLMTEFRVKYNIAKLNKLKSGLALSLSLANFIQCYY
jgi:hypothetical protein